MDKLLLAEAKALIIQMFIRGEYRYNGSTERQVNDLIGRISQSLGHPYIIVKGTH